MKFKKGDKVQINMDKILTKHKRNKINNELKRISCDTSEIFTVRYSPISDSYNGNYILYYHDKRVLRDTNMEILCFRAAELRLVNDNKPNKEKNALISWIGGELHGKQL